MSTGSDRSRPTVFLTVSLLGLAALGCGSDGKEDSKETDTKETATGEQGDKLVTLVREQTEVQCECAGSDKDLCLDLSWSDDVEDCMRDVYAKADKDAERFACADKVAQKAVDCMSAADCDESAQEKCSNTYFDGILECIDQDTQFRAWECMGGTITEE